MSGNLFNDPRMLIWIVEMELFCMLNWIIRNKTVFDIEIVLMLNWIVWNRTVCLKLHLALITYNDRCPIKPNQTKPNYFF